MVNIMNERAVEIFGFSVWAILWNGIQVFVPKKKMVFIAVCRFPVSLHLDLEKTSGISDFVCDVEFGFSYLAFGFSLISTPALISNSRKTPTLYQLASFVQ